MKFLTYLPLTLSFLVSISVSAQSPVNGFMQKEGKGSVALSYNSEAYNEVYLVPQKINEVPIFNRMTLKSASVYFTYGLTDKINVVFNIPYIQSQGAADPQVLKNLGYENTRAGFQDITVYAKYRCLTINREKFNFNLIGAAGIKSPLGDYRVNDGLQSIVAIGNKSSSLNLLGIGTIRHQSGLFACGQAGYSLRNNDVPDALISELKVGFIQAHYYFDAFIANQTSTSGTDILAEGFEGFFPSTRVNYTRVGLNIYVPIADKFGVCLGGSRYLDGRNVGKSTGFYGGISYSF